MPGGAPPGKRAELTAARATIVYETADGLSIAHSSLAGGRTPSRMTLSGPSPNPPFANDVARRTTPCHGAEGQRRALTGECVAQPLFPGERVVRPFLLLDAPGGWLCWQEELMTLLGGQTAWLSLRMASVTLASIRGGVPPLDLPQCRRARPLWHTFCFMPLAAPSATRSY